jgi:hypothetical protein
MAAIMSANGSGRKTLAEQLDRLDAVLDSLAENLNDTVTAAVAAVVKEVIPTAVQEAVHAAVLEALADAQRQRQVISTRLPSSEPAVPVPVRLADRARRCWTWLVGAAQDAWNSVTTVAQAARARAFEASHHSFMTARAKAKQVREQLIARARVWRMRLLVLVTIARRLRRRLLVSLGVGVVAGLVAYLAGPVVVSVAFGLVSLAASMVVGGWEPLRWGRPVRKPVVNPRAT